MATDRTGRWRRYLGRALHDALAGETVELNTHTDAELRASAGLPFRVIIDPAMPPGQYEVRSGDHAQRVVYDDDPARANAANRQAAAARIEGVLDWGGPSHMAAMGWSDSRTPAQQQRDMAVYGPCETCGTARLSATTWEPGGSGRTDLICPACTAAEAVYEAAREARDGPGAMAAWWSRRTGQQITVFTAAEYLSAFAYVAAHDAARVHAAMDHEDPVGQAAHAARPGQLVAVLTGAAFRRRRGEVWVTCEGSVACSCGRANTHVAGPRCGGPSQEAPGGDTTFASGGVVARGGGALGPTGLLGASYDDFADAMRYTTARVRAALAQAAQGSIPPTIRWDERGVFTVEGGDADQREFLEQVRDDDAYQALRDALADGDDAALAGAVAQLDAGGELAAALADVREARDQHLRLLAQAEGNAEARARRLAEQGVGYEERTHHFRHGGHIRWTELPGERRRHPLVTARMEAAARSGMEVWGRPDPVEVAAAERCPLPLRELDDTDPLQLAGGPGAHYWAWRHVARGIWIGHVGEEHNGLDPAVDLTAPVATTAGGVRALLADRGLDEQDSP